MWFFRCTIVKMSVDLQWITWWEQPQTYRDLSTRPPEKGSCLQPHRKRHHEHTHTHTHERTHTHITSHLHAHMPYSLLRFLLALNTPRAATMHSRAYMLCGAAAQHGARIHYCQNRIGQITVSNCVLLSLSQGDKSTNKQNQCKAGEKALSNRVHNQVIASTI